MDEGNTGIHKSNHFRKKEQAYLEELQPKFPRDNIHSYLRPIYSWYHACIMQPIIITNTSTRETDNEEAVQNVNQMDPISRCPLA